LFESTWVEVEVEVEVKVDGSGSGSGSESVYVGFDYFFIYMLSVGVDYRYNCFGLLIFWCSEFSWIMNFHLYDCQVNKLILPIIIYRHFDTNKKNMYHTFKALKTENLKKK